MNSKYRTKRLNLSGLALDALFAYSGTGGKEEMTTKHYIEGALRVSESIENNMVAVIVPELAAGSADIVLFDCAEKPPVVRGAEPFLRGEDYPALVKVWDNEEDERNDMEVGNGK